MHILIIHQAFASLDEPGGTRHFEFAQQLVAKGNRVTVIASPVNYITGSRVAFPASELPHQDDLIGLRIMRATVYAAHHRSFVHRTLAFISFMASSFWLGAGVPDVNLVWGTSPPIFQAVSAWLLARLKRVPFLFEVRDLWPLFAVEAGVLRSRFLIGLSGWLERVLYRAADCVVVNSPGYVEHVRLRGARRVAIVPNGADPSMFDGADGGPFRGRNGLEDRFVVLYAGAHGMSNDLGVLLHAAIQLQKTDVQIVLVGDGKEKPALQALAEDLGLRNVSFLPSVPKTEMPGVLAGADACIAILKPLDPYKTTYPNKVFDYMAAGRPVLLAIDGVIRDVVEAAGCGLFVTPGDPSALADAIRRLRTDPESARAMGLEGQRYLARNFNRQSITGRLIEVLEATSGKRSGDDSGC